MHDDGDDGRNLTIPNTTVVEPRARAAAVDGDDGRPHTPFLTVLAGGPIGRVFELDREQMVIGRSPGCSICLDDDSVSRRHAILRLDPGGGVSLEDVGSTNGTFVNGDRVDHATLADGDRLLIGSTVVFKLNLVDSPESRAQRHLWEAAHRDALTGLYNQRAFHGRFAEEFAFARRHRTPLALILLDLDQFKQVNDRHGHGAGDELLQQLAAAVASALRDEDVLCRYGGDELAVIVRQLEHAAAVRLAERVRDTVAATRCPVRDDAGVVHDTRVTVSAGIATLDPEAHRECRDLLDAADSRLLQAKRSGRNRVCGD